MGGDFSVCPTAPERSHVARASAKHASRKHVVRKLWSEGHGHYSTKGNYAAGAVLGTRWLTEDLCEGTLIRVVTDRVAVTNLVNHRHVTVRAGTQLPGQGALTGAWIHTRRTVRRPTGPTVPARPRRSHSGASSSAASAARRPAARASSIW